MARVRGRFDIVVVFGDGAYVRFTSHKERSLSAEEILARLREYATYIENGLKAEQKKQPEEVPCAGGHVWSNQFGDDWTPDVGTRCDCGLKRWGSLTDDREDTLMTTSHPGRAHIEALRALPAAQQRSALEHLVDLVPFDVLWHAVLNYAKANPAVVQVLAQQSAEAVLTIIVRAIGKTQNPVCTYIDTHPDAQQAITQQLFEIIQTLIRTAIDDALV